MTPGERLGSLYGTGWADRPGAGTFAMGLIAKMTPGLSIGECYLDPEKFARAYIRVQQTLGFDSGPMFGHASLGAAEFGGELSYPAPNSRAQSPMVRKHPIDTPEKVDSMEVPEISKVKEVVSECKGANWVVENYPAGFNGPSIVCGSPFSLGGNAIGVEQMLLWMIEEPDLVHKVMDRMSEFLIEKAKYIVANVGPIMLFDGGPTEANDLISPKQFETFALPYLKKVREGALKAGIPGFLCHPCGDQNGNIEMWAEAPGNFAVNFDFRTPLEKVVKVFGPKSMIIGNIEPAKFQYSDYDYIYKTTMDYMKIAATNCPHGYMVGPGCEIPTDTPALHVGAMLQATRDYAQSKEWQERRPR
jgi:uroporphyrinogen decarboxylase